jgi:aerobic carbon-monoxide dehydrogenase medium subunit
VVRRQPGHSRTPRSDTVKPPPFEYRRARSIEDALGLLAEFAPDAKVLAGGQSLAPMLNLRLARPDVVIDITRIPGLRSIELEDGTLVVGALTRHDQFEHYPARLPGFEVLRQAAPLVGHQPIRTRGTIGGSLAHADAAAEWCILAVLLEAELVARSVRGQRILPAVDFFTGLFTTELAEDELITEVRFVRPRRHAAIEEFARRHGDFAIVAVSVAFDVEAGRIADPRVVLGGVSSRPVRCREAEDELAGAAPESATFASAGQALASTIEPPADVHATSEVRRRLAANLLERAAVRALADGNEVLEHA